MTDHVVHWYRDGMSNEDFPCTTCGAESGQYCTTLSGAKAKRPHCSRSDHGHYEELRKDPPEYWTKEIMIDRIARMALLLDMFTELTDLTRLLRKVQEEAASWTPPRVGEKWSWRPVYWNELKTLPKHPLVTNL